MPWSSCSDAGQGDGKAVTLRLPPHPCAVAMKAEAMIAWLHPAPSRTVATSVGPCLRPVPFYPGTDLLAERLSHHLQQLEPGLIEILLELSARYRDPVLEFGRFAPRRRLALCPVRPVDARPRKGSLLNKRPNAPERGSLGAFETCFTTSLPLSKLVSQCFRIVRYFRVTSVDLAVSSGSPVPQLIGSLDHQGTLISAAKCFRFVLRSGLPDSPLLAVQNDGHPIMNVRCLAGGVASPSSSIRPIPRFPARYRQPRTAPHRAGIARSASSCPSDLPPRPKPSAG